MTQAAPPSTRRLFCFGLGYTAEALARAMLAEGWCVAGTCRDEQRRDALASCGIETWTFDAPHPLADAAEALADTTHLLSSIPPGAAGDPVLDAHGDDIAALARGSLIWAGYLSTTAVYGDRRGGWVDERSRLDPTQERGRRRVTAERGWLDLWREHEVPVHLFRLAGIYGPGRNALEAVRAGRAQRIDKPGQVFSRVHVDDIVKVLRASMAHPNPGAAYNVCDDVPAPPANVIDYACGLLGVEPPPLVPFETAELTPLGRSFYADNKRVRNDRIKRELGVTLAYPDFRSGLDALLTDGD